MLELGDATTWSMPVGADGNTWLRDLLNKVPVVNCSPATVFTVGRMQVPVGFSGSASMGTPGLAAVPRYISASVVGLAPRIWMRSVVAVMWSVAGRTVSG